EEIDELAGRGVPVGDNLMLSDRAHVILPWHVEEERVFKLGASDAEAIGTTMRGIGPCYSDKAARHTYVRFGDMYRDNFRDRITRITGVKNITLRAHAGEKFTPLDAGEIYQTYRGHAERLRPYVGDTTEYLLTALESGRKVLFEGA